MATVLKRATLLKTAQPIVAPPIATPPPVGTYVPPARPAQTASAVRKATKISPGVVVAIVCAATFCLFVMVIAAANFRQAREKAEEKSFRSYLAKEHERGKEFTEATVHDLWTKPVPHQARKIEKETYKIAK